MALTPLTAITPIDGRYISKTSSLQAYFSEAALIKFRVQVEIEYFIALCNSSILQLNHFPENKFTTLRNLYTKFNESDAKRIKEIEITINHDVKAVEYFIKEKFDKLGLKDYREFIHFGLTSQDINNTALPLMIRDSLDKVIFPSYKAIIKEIHKWLCS